MDAFDAREEAQSASQLVFPLASQVTAISGMADRVVRLSDGRVASDQPNPHKIGPRELAW